MVSVIIPVYRAKETLEEAVDSVLSQAYEDFELLLIDDGSDDGSGELCDELAVRDDRIRVIHQVNGGAAKARNTGTAQSNGEWICFMDSDDVIAHDFLARLMDMAYGEGADIVSCAHAKCLRSEISDRNAYFKNQASKVKHEVQVYKGDDGVKALLYQKGFISAPWGMISKKALWSDISFPEGTAAEDMGTIYRLFLAASTIARTDEILYGYVQSADNTVYSTSNKRNPDYYAHSRQMVSYIRNEHPSCLKAAASRHFSTCFQILSETAPENAGVNQDLANLIYKDIKSLRHTVLCDGNARIQNRGAALLSYISIPLLHKLLHDKYLKSIPHGDRNGNPTKLALAEYQGRCDTNGKAVGHAPKVLVDYYQMICHAYDVKIYAPESIIKELPQDLANSTTALGHMIIMKGHPSLADRVTNKLRMFANIRRILKKADAEVIWFFNVEFYLFLYLALLGNDGRKIVVTMFLDGYHTGSLAVIKQKIFEFGQRRVQHCISTGPSFSFRNMPYTFIPDYAYDEARYDRYRSLDKRPYAVCLGTMDHGKQLEELVSAFNNISYKLIIAGRFYDKERLIALKKAAHYNIDIRDEYLSDDEYLTLLGHAAYAVLPYNEANYHAQTSGVLQEAVFTDAIVLTHEDILSGNKTPGIGYKDYGEITDELLAEETASDRNKKILGEYERLRKEVYDKNVIKSEITKSLSA